MYLISGIRGGVSQCSKRYAAANNKYIDTFDSSKDSSYILYLDCNNLYGHAMMQPLPRDGFQWIYNPQFSVEDIMNLADDAPIGYVFEVDLGYPHHLHDLHSDFPFCAENAVPPNSKGKVKKLLLTLNDKNGYVLHYRMLKIALKHGLVLKKIHAVLKFNQSPWTMVEKIYSIKYKRKSQSSKRF